MILAKIWERKMFLNIVKTALFFLFSISLLIIIIDFSIHSAKIFAHTSTSVFIITKYYLNLLILQLNLFLSLSFLLTCIKVLSDMNIHNELTALRMSTISSKYLSRPFFLTAFIFVVFSFINFEYFYPNALNFKDNFKERYLKKTKYDKKIHPNVIYLQNNIKLVYQKFDTTKKELSDVYIIKSSSDIWHAKYLFLNAQMAYGKYVDHLEFKNDFFEKEKSYLTFVFQDIKLDKNVFLFVPHENRSISTLFKQSLAKNICLREKNELLANLNYKIISPLVPLLVVFAIFPFLIRFSKNISIFFISSFSLFGFVIFYTILDSSLIIAENSSISPFIIMWSPIIIVSSIFGKNFSKI
jgi:lipopolysaccharide export system permease protein